MVHLKYSDKLDIARSIGHRRKAKKITKNSFGDSFPPIRLLVICWRKKCRKFSPFEKVEKMRRKELDESDVKWHIRKYISSLYTSIPSVAVSICSFIYGYR